MIGLMTRMRLYRSLVLVEKSAKETRAVEAMLADLKMPGSLEGLEAILQPSIKREQTGRCSIAVLSSRV